ncbi:probable glutamate receptor [Limulus polyphemus]|uniref:Probable glutamate receptor n=1 Tax=Limulus polyphemus TaxID=6850 RepID=A0ABM1TSA3_LIMPO|nr:probable glutamate receptor [Limulus polyphemus]
MTAFSGQLISKLTLRKATDRIDSLEDLLDRPHVTPVIERGGFFESVIKNKESGIYKRFWDVLSKYPENRKPMREMLTDEMIDKIEARTHAISLQSITLRSRINTRFNDKGSCSLYIAKKQFFPKTTVAAMRRGLPKILKTQIKQKISIAVDNDLFGYWIEMMMRNYKRCITPLPSTFRPLAVEDLRDPIFQRIFPIRQSSCNTSMAYSFPLRNTPSQARHIRVVAEEWLPFVKVDKIGACLAVRGPMAEILHFIATNLNFSYTVIQPEDHQWGSKKSDGTWSGMIGLLHRKPEDHQWGSKKSNGTWSGMIGLLHRKEAEFLVTPASANLHRLEVADFTVPLTIDSQGLLVASPAEENNAFGFFFSLNWEVWLTLLVSMSCLSAVSWIFELVKETQLPEEETTGVLEQWWNFCICILLQGFENVPSRSSQRILIAVWLVGCFVTMTAFSGQLISKLTLRKATDRIDSLEDLLDRPQVTPVIERGSFLESVIKKEDQGVYKRLWDVVSTNPEHRQPVRELLSEEMIDKVEARTHAVSLQSITMRAVIHNRFNKNGYCTLYMAKKKFLTKTTVAVMRKDLPTVLKTRIKQKISMAVDNDLFGYWIEMMMRNYERCATPLPSTFRPLAVEDLRGAFYCLSTGLGLSILFFIIESRVYLKITKQRAKAGRVKP